MLILANIRTAIEQLWSNKMRSVLTVLGIVIAVASTITVVSVVSGFTGYVAEFLQGLGTNAMWVWPYRPPGDLGKTLGRVEMTVDDMGAIERQCSAIRSISPMIRAAFDDEAVLLTGRPKIEGYTAGAEQGWSVDPRLGVVGAALDLTEAR